MTGQLVAHQRALQGALGGDAVELVQLQPEPLGRRAVQLTGTHQHRAQALDRPLQGDGEQLRRIVGVLRNQLHDDQFVAHRQMVLQRLAKRQGLAGPLTEHDGLVEKVTLQLPADEVDLRAQFLQQMHAFSRIDAQAIELDHRLVETPRRLAEIGLGQRGEPAFEVANVGLAERQRLAIRCGHTQQQRLAETFQQVTPRHDVSASVRWGLGRLYR